MSSAGGATATRPALQVEALSKSFRGIPALDRFDLTIPAGEIHALAGANGSGKSTFIKILAGYFEPDPGGSILVAGEPMPGGSAKASHALGARFVQQDLGLIETLSMLDNLFLGDRYPCVGGTIRRRKARELAQQDLARFGLTFSPDTLVGELAAADRAGVAIARALRGVGAGAVKLLVLDEPTATLPDREVHRLLDILRRVSAQGVAILYVTHRLDEIFEIAGRVTVLRDGRKVATVPTADLDRKSLVRMLVGGELDTVRSVHESLETPDPEQQPVLLHVEHLAAGPLRDTWFEVRAGEIVGLAGVTGSGSEAVLGSVFGSRKRSSGTVRVDGRAISPARPDQAIAAAMAYVPPDRKLLGGIMDSSATINLTLADLSRFWRGGWLRKSDEESEARRWFDALGVRPSGQIHKPLGTFSGGNQQKVVLAKWLRCSPKVLLLDEPTQGVDVGTKAEIHRRVLAAKQDGAAVVVNSTDIDELDALCDRVLVFRRGRVATELSREDISVARISHECLDS
jgi:ribose transport system ATP-binding protein